MDPAWAWRVLGLPPGSGTDDVRRAFRLGAQLMHPDRVAALGADVVAEAHRRMVELAEAYRVCSAVATGLPPPPPRPQRADETAPARHGPLHPVGGQAAALLAEARAMLAPLAPLDAYRGNRPTRLAWDDNAEQSRAVVATLEQVADAWPGTAEGDAARALLVSSVAALNTLSARERAGHLVLVVDDAARDDAWEALSGRDELAVAQVVHAHRTAGEHLRRKARTRLAELGDWATLTRDDDEDVRRTAAAHLLLQEGRALQERAAWLTRRERPDFTTDLTDWSRRVQGAATGPLATSLREDLVELESAVRVAAGPARATR